MSILLSTFKVDNFQIIMKYTFLIFFSAFFCFLSCNEDDDMTTTPSGPVITDPNMINEFTWQTLVDESAISTNEDFSVSYPVIHENTVVYSNSNSSSNRDGFAALDRSTGSEVWNNYGQMELGLVTEEPSVAFGVLHIVNENTFKSIDLSSGAILNDVAVDLLGNEVLSERIGVFEGNVYANVQVQNGFDVRSEWLISPVNNASPESFIRFNQSDVGDLGKPVFHRTTNDEVLMIYSISFPRAAITAYNLSTNQVEWEIDDFASAGVLSDIEVDDNGIYIAVGLSMIALNPNTGEEIWSRTHFVNDLEDEDGLVQDDTRIYAVGAEVYVIDKASGDLIWSAQGFERDNGPFVPLRNGFKPVLYQNNLYFTDRSAEGLLIWVDLADMEMDFFFIRESDVVEIDGDPVRVDGLSFQQSGLAISNEGTIFSHDRLRFLAFDAPMF